MKNLIINNFGMFPISPPYVQGCIKSLLTNKNIQSEILDVNIITWKHLLSREFLNECEFRPVSFKKTQVPFSLISNKKSFNEIKSNVIRNIDTALAVFKDKINFFNINKLTWACSIVFQAQQIVFYHYGTFITNKIILWPEIGYNVKSVAKINDLSSNETNNPFIKIFEKYIIPQIIAKNPRLIGIDIAFPWEVIQALTLNKLIKKHLPSTHINFTGFGFDEFCYARIQNELKSNSDLMFGFDSAFMVRNDNELSKLFSLSDFSPSNLQSLKSFSFFNSSTNSLTINEPFEEVDINLDLIPDYSDTNVKEYFSPHAIAIEKMSSKCFWSRCSYCSINSYKKFRNEVNVTGFIDRIKTYQDKYDINYFFFLDEAVSLEHAEQLSNQLDESQLHVIWSIRTRISENFNYNLLKKLYNSGCRELWIGLEAVDPQLLEDFNKTENVELYLKNTQEIIKNCSEIGIGLHFCLIFGFPTESKAQRKSVYNFFKKIEKDFSKNATFLTFNIFGLNYGSKVYNKYTEYGIEKIITNKDDYNMINVPYIPVNPENEVKSVIFEKEITNLCNRITDILVKSEPLKLLWFFSCDSPWELMLKAHFSNKSNPFQKRPSIVERMAIKVYPLIEKNAFLLRIWNNIVNKTFVKSES
ncbi:MAG: hypothetical protein KAQ75_17265 [Bacteroidales bacterium]|nr:hypothetical protein [Bacteroidales bacterium]